MKDKLPDPSYVEKLLAAVEKHPHGMLWLVVLGIVAVAAGWVWRH